MLQESKIGSGDETGWCYTRGRSTVGGSSLVWVRAGLHKPVIFDDYSRIIIHTLDRAIGDAYTFSKNTKARFTVVIDSDRFSFSCVPKLAQLKVLFRFMQDHYPDRLDCVLITNLSTPVQIVLKMALSLISPEVRGKIHIIPNNLEERDRALSQLIDPSFVPYWLGGKDEWRFSPDNYYGQVTASDREGREYITTMPYHTE